MPQSISAPLPHAVAEPSARERTRAADKQSWSAQPIESRLSALETRWEVTAPALATIADLRGVENRLIRWVLGAAAGLLLALAGVVSTTHSRFDSVNARLDSVNDRINSVNARIDSVAAELRAEIRDTNARMEARFEKMEARFERLDSKFDALMSELRSQRNDSR